MNRSTRRSRRRFWVCVGICDCSKREEFERKHAEIAKNKGGSLRGIPLEWFYREQILMMLIFSPRPLRRARRRGPSRALRASVQNSSGFLIFKQLRLLKAVKNPLTKPEWSTKPCETNRCLIRLSDSPPRSGRSNHPAPSAFLRTGRGAAIQTVLIPYQANAEGFDRMNEPGQCGFGWLGELPQFHQISYPYSEG